MNDIVLNGRERFKRTMHFQIVDRVPMIEVGCWEQTRDRWLKEGMPSGTGLERSIITLNGNKFFGLDEQFCINITVGIVPIFEEDEVINEDEYTITIKDTTGTVIRRMKDNSSMPQFIHFPIQNRKDFEAMKWRYYFSYNFSNLEEVVKYTKTCNCPVYCPNIGAIGFYSIIRGMMGTENACTIFYDDPILAHEMVEFTTELAIKGMEPILKDIKFDYFMWWEDFAFKNGPLVSPEIFKEFLMPGYRKVNDVLKAKGIDIIFLDTDGDPRVLIPLLLESGINLLYPLEQCAEGMDPRILRKEYGRDLLLWGGIDKRALIKGKKDIEQELFSKLPSLIEEGGYIPQLDHLVTPEVSYENWLYYLEIKRKICEGHYE